MSAVNRWNGSRIFDVSCCIIICKFLLYIYYFSSILLSFNNSSICFIINPTGNNSFNFHLILSLTTINFRISFNNIIFISTLLILVFSNNNQPTFVMENCDCLYCQSREGKAICIGETCSNLTDKFKCEECS